MPSEKHPDKSHHTINAGLKPPDYLRQAKAHLLAGRQEAAYALLQRSLEHFPNEPVLLSHYGLLLVLLDKRYRTGIETCQQAIEKHKKNTAFDEEMLYPLLYYNLGKAYTAAGKRKEAVKAFKMGIAYDSGNNNDVKKELLRMGMKRGNPSIPFLERSNPLNKYIGLMLNKKHKASDAKK